LGSHLRWLALGSVLTVILALPAYLLLGLTFYPETHPDYWRLPYWQVFGAAGLIATILVLVVARMVRRA
jgi:hypothetical protein